MEAKEWQQPGAGQGQPESGREARRCTWVSVAVNLLLAVGVGRLWSACVKRLVPVAIAQVDRLVLWVAEIAEAVHARVLAQHPVLNILTHVDPV